MPLLGELLRYRGYDGHSQVDRGIKQKRNNPAAQTAALDSGRRRRSDTRSSFNSGTREAVAFLILGALATTLADYAQRSCLGGANLTRRKRW